MNFQFQNNVVARYKDGKTIKGVTHDFGPMKKIFHIVANDANGRQIHEIATSDLKALFFVKSLEGDCNHAPTLKLTEKTDKTTGALLLKIVFSDGEIFIGTTHGYTPDREGFFVVPVHKDSNNIRAYIISSAVDHVETLRYDSET